MFTLIWSDEALDELADAYVASTGDERARITKSVESLNSQLQVDPLSVGESRSGGKRICFPKLLAIIFHVSITDQTVRVISTKRFGT